MQPTQIAEGAGITTRQQRKRVSSETHQGPGTPEVGDLCFVLFSTVSRCEPDHHILSSELEGSLSSMEVLLSNGGEGMPYCSCSLPHSPRKLPAASHAP